MRPITVRLPDELHQASGDRARRRGSPGERLSGEPSSEIPMLNRAEVLPANLDPPHDIETGTGHPVLIVRAQPLLLDSGQPSTLIIRLITSLVSKAEPLRLRMQALHQPTLDIRGHNLNPRLEAYSTSTT